MRRSLSTLVVILCLSVAAASQLISLKTIPVATGDRFMIFPSRNLAICDVTIALDDPLPDPCVNPAQGTHLKGALLFGAPSFYAVGDRNGSAKTIPLGGMIGKDRIFGGAAPALQDLALSGDIVLAPTKSLTLQETRVTTHSFTVSIPVCQGPATGEMCGPAKEGFAGLPGNGRRGAGGFRYNKSGVETV